MNNIPKKYTGTFSFLTLCILPMTLVYYIIPPLTVRPPIIMPDNQTFWEVMKLFGIRPFWAHIDHARNNLIMDMAPAIFLFFLVALYERHVMRVHNPVSLKKHIWIGFFFFLLGYTTTFYVGWVRIIPAGREAFIYSVPYLLLVSTLYASLCYFSSWVVMWVLKWLRGY